MVQEPADPRHLIRPARHRTERDDGLRVVALQGAQECLLEGLVGQQPLQERVIPRRSPQVYGGDASQQRGPALEQIGALDWFYVLVVTLALVLVLWLLVSRFGDVKLGKDDDEPDFSTFSWICMLFSAGLGIGLLY